MHADGRHASSWCPRRTPRQWPPAWALRLRLRRVAGPFALQASLHARLLQPTRVRLSDAAITERPFAEEETSLNARAAASRYPCRSPAPGPPATRDQLRLAAARRYF